MPSEGTPHSIEAALDAHHARHAVHNAQGTVYMVFAVRIMQPTGRPPLGLLGWGIFPTQSNPIHFPLELYKLTLDIGRVGQGVGLCV